MKEKMIAAYTQFWDARESITTQMSTAPYDWYQIPNQLPGIFIPYCQMLNEFSNDIANIINEFARYISNLEAWKFVINDIHEEIKFNIIVEFISPFASLALNMPYSIKSRFYYVCAHLCNQANMVLDIERKDDIPKDNEINYNTFVSFCKKWNKYRDLKNALDNLSNNNYKNNTKEFRNKYTHRYSLGIEI